MKITIDKHVLWEAFKEPLRLLLLALISWVLTVIFPQIDESWVPIMTIVLRFIEKWLYELGKKRASMNQPAGITAMKLPF